MINYFLYCGILLHFKFTCSGLHNLQSRDMDAENDLANHSL